MAYYDYDHRHIDNGYDLRQCDDIENGKYVIIGNVIIIMKTAYCS